MSQKLIVSVSRCTTIDPSTPVHIAVYELTENFKERIRQLSGNCKALGVRDSSMLSSCAEYFDISSLLGADSGEVIDIDSMRPFEVVTDCDTLTVGKDSFKHSCSERHAEIDPMYQTALAPIDILDSSAAVILINDSEGLDEVSYIDAGELTVERLLAVAGI